MKKKLVIKTMLLACSSILCLSYQSPVKAETNATNHVDGIVNLAADTNYYYDLDGDGDNDEFYYQSIENEEDYLGAVFKLYINGTLYLTRKDGGFGYGMQICDLDTSDSSLDLYFYAIMDSDGIAYSSFARFDGTKVSEYTGIKEKRPSKSFGMFRYSLDTINGDGTFKVAVDTPVYSEAIGCYVCYFTYQLKDGKISNIPTTTYAFTKYSKTYKYKAKKAFTVYKKVGSKQAAFQVKKGTTITFDKLYVTKSGNAYVRAINKAGKKGWIRASLKDLFYERPLWG